VVNRLVHRKLPPKYDLLRRVHGWKETAGIASQARNELALPGAAFIIAEHYGLTSELSFYMPEAKSRVCGEPLVYFYAAAHPRNQFYFWSDYLHRSGQDALFIREIDRPALRPDWFQRWWRQEPGLYLPAKSAGGPPPLEVQRQFESFADLGIRDVTFNGAVVRRVQIILCRHLR
jgi:hypothetical protein